MNEVIRTILARRSIRGFQPRQVEEEIVAQILECGRFANCACGKQSVEFF